MRDGELPSALIEEMSVTAMRHPSSTFEVAAEACVGSLWLLNGIKLKHDPGDLAPVRIVGIGIKQPKIGDQMSAIVSRNCRVGWRSIGNRGTEQALRHDGDLEHQLAVRQPHRPFRARREEAIVGSLETRDKPLRLYSVHTKVDKPRTTPLASVPAWTCGDWSDGT